MLTVFETSECTRQGITSKKNKHLSPTHNPLLSVRMEALLALSDDAGSSVGAGLGQHDMEGETTH